ncbi:glycerophosphodiester phosphodiesterase [Tengunoibacter tsumagoiensis]|uniref:Glycerophosphoryl diester phosphodiesterase n=1 Tax=Tengunoibacter tsumagoiensis TaxID=2014871 RepID=A0A401ZYB1_9CHLR|nr:glycerophosphodiester phosphodiesterase family protein [Tengunoibacter tsumagoiensis]GCE11820.1 glycerophosphoryl diester phosphodiesterase [Tengunoibacter tsumagoiensis]
MNQVQRVAHRGGAQLAPENTLAAFRNALTLPVDAIELDVQLSRDGQLVVFHDNTLDRLTNGTGNILDVDFADLRSLNAAASFPGGWPQPEQIPTLAEVLALVKGRLRVYIEIKLSKRDGVYGRYPKIAEAVVREVWAAKMLSQVLFISFDWPVLTELRSIESDLQVGALVSHDLWTPKNEQSVRELCDEVLSRGCQWVSLDQRLFADPMVNLIHQRGLKLALWTVNKAADLERLARAGVDSLTTDRPDLFSYLS